MTIARIVGDCPQADEQLERADHVDVVHRARPTCPGRAAGRSSCARRCRPRPAAISGAMPGSRMSASMSSVRAELAGAACACRARRRPRTRVALEPGGEEGPEVAPHAGDQHPAAQPLLGRLLALRGRALRREPLLDRVEAPADLAQLGLAARARSSWVAGRRSSSARRPRARPAPAPLRRLSTVPAISSIAPCVRSRWRSAEPSVAWTVRSTASRSSEGVLGRFAMGAAV